jgi:hypothetical protein
MPLPLIIGKAREQGHEFEVLGKPVHLPDLLAKLRTSPERIRFIEHVRSPIGSMESTSISPSSMWYRAQPVPESG